MKCQDCKKQEGKKTTCPYAYELRDERIKVVLCDECYYERAQAV